MPLLPVVLPRCRRSILLGGTASLTTLLHSGFQVS
jgi:hypothetical protein